MVFSLTCAIYFNYRVHVRLYERRWTKDGGIMRWKNESEGNVRRSQVVTLQNDVLSLLPKEVQDALHPHLEPVWRRSQNIPIRLIEDCLLQLMQSDRFAGNFHSFLYFYLLLDKS